MNQEKLILKKINNWSSAGREVRIPEELIKEVEEVSKKINMPIKYVCAEFIDYALKNHEIK